MLKYISYFNKQDMTNDNKNIHAHILHTLDDFYNTPEHHSAIQTILKSICEFFEINRLCFFIDKNKTSYQNIFEYQNQTELKNDLETLEINFYSKNTQDYTNEIKVSFLNLFQNQKLFYTTEFQKFQSLLQDMNFQSDSPNQINELLLFLIHDSSYLIMERHEDQQPLSKESLSLIELCCKTLQARILSFSTMKQLQNDVLIYDTLIQHEEIPMAIIEKESGIILQHNSLYKQILPTIQIGEQYEQREIHSNCCMTNGDQLLPHIHDANRYWIQKSTTFTMKDGREAFLIYAKDTKDYIKQLTTFDTLTGALSLHGFEQYYHANIISSEHKYALCTIDVDKFKHINNLFGYQVGNEILQQMALVLQNFLNEGEICCRLNEDKFAMIIRYSILDDVTERFSELKNDFELMRKIHFDNKKITVIGGICMVNPAKSLNLLLDQANIARKIAKGSHNNRFAFYNSKLEKEAEQERLIEERMFSAVTNEEFFPFLQAKFNLITRELCGAEALVRWNAPTGLIYPDEFIPLFEKNGFINILDFIIYRKVMKYMRTCLDAGIPLCPISINVSRGHIPDKNFIHKIMDLIETYDIPLDLLELEITESMFVEDKDALKNFIQQLKNHNIQVSIDDFGTAYSSLHILKDIEVDALKIDKEFLHNVDSRKSNFHTKDEIVIKHIINMAKELNFKIVCEGIETEEQVELLKRIGCQYGQGYLFAKPMSLEKFDETFFSKYISSQTP